MEKIYEVGTIDIGHSVLRSTVVPRYIMLCLKSDNTCKITVDDQNIDDFQDFFIYRTVDDEYGAKYLKIPFHDTVDITNTTNFNSFERIIKYMIMQE